jgi:RNA polymerase sigma factor (sigma-70 family)
MANEPTHLLAKHLHSLSTAARMDRLPDGQLLQRFAAGRDEDAFAALVRRHGSIVLQVCRRVLRDVHDVEDVFQATFLVLIRKAASLRRVESVGCFLHGVAYRLSLKARTRFARQRRHESQATVKKHSDDPLAELSMREAQAIFDEELSRLPEKFRAPLVLCCLESQTRDEAARQLGWPAKLVKSRLEQGRERLRYRLSQRGLTLPTTMIATLLAEEATPAVVPAVLTHATVRAAMTWPGNGVSAPVAFLAEGALGGGATVKAKVVMGLLLLSGVLVAGIGVFAPLQPVAEQAVMPSEAKAPQPPKSEKQEPTHSDRFGDPLPERAVARLGTVRFRMSGLVYACACSPDGKTLAAGCSDSSLILFDAVTGKPLRHFQGYQFHITSLAFAPDGQTLASGSADRKINIWEVATGKQLRQLISQPQQAQPIWSLAFTPDGKGLISAGEDAKVRLWDPAAGKIIRHFTGHQNDVRCAALSPDGRTLASAADKEIWLWETATGKMIHRLTGQKEPIRALAFSPDGKMLASGSNDISISSVWLWETATGKVLRRLPDDPKEIRQRQTVCARSLAFSPDGKKLAAGYGDYALCLWDVATGKKLHKMPGMGSFTYRSFHDGGIQCVVFSRDGKRLVLAHDNQFALLDLQSGKEISPLQAARGAMNRVFFSPDGKRLFTTTEEPGRGILEWDTASGRLIRQVPGVAGGVNQVSFSPDRKIMASSGNGQELALWDTATGKEIRRIPLSLKQFQTPSNVVYSPDGKLVAVEEGEGKAVWLYDPATGKQVCTVENMKTSAYPMLLAFSPNGRILAALDRKAIHLAEVPSGRSLPSIVPPKERYAVAAAFSPDGRTLAAPDISLFNGVRMILWEVATGKERLAFPKPPGQIGNVAFSSDGRLLAAGGSGNMVYVWDALTGELLTRLKGHQGAINSLAFSPDGHRLASGSSDTTALIWDVTGLARERPCRGPLCRKELDELWSTLGGADAAKAYQSILTLESCLEQAVPLLAEHLHLSTVDKKILRLLALLDSDDFTQRERATRELQVLGWAAEPALHRALEGKPSLEVRNRVKELLDGIRKQPLPLEMVRILRGMEVLEQIGTPAARKVLASLALGVPQARLTREAKAALERLTHHSSNIP